MPSGTAIAFAKPSCESLGKNAGPTWTTSLIRATSCRDEPPGAGAAPGRKNLKPLSPKKNEERLTRNTRFYAALGRMHHTAPSRRSTRHAPWARGRADALGELLAEKRLLTAPHIPASTTDHAAPRRPVPPEDDDHPVADSELGSLLDAIASDVHKTASAARDGVMTEFAARAAHARKHLSRNQLAAALKEIEEARKAALALIKQNETAELSARRSAALAARRRSRIVTKSTSQQPAPGF